MVKHLFLVFVAFFIFIDLGKGQITFGMDSIMLQRFDFEDKQIAEFFDRFNYKEPVKFANNLKSTRARNIIALINLKDTGLSHSPETLNFLNLVSNDSNEVHLGFYDENWYAISHCSFSYLNKNCLIDIILKPEAGLDSSYRWVIFDVKSDIFPAPTKANRNITFINPMDHEVGFSELSKALIKRNSIFQYTSDSYRADYLSAFLIMVKSGILKFNQINFVDFQFLQVKGWEFTVKNFNRSDYNSGWLISSIKKMTETEKHDYIKNHFMNNL
jgi:hypothetical protein